MTYSDLTARERRFLALIHGAEAADTPAYIGALAILHTGAEQAPASFEGIYSRGDFKKAIKRLRGLQQDRPQYAGIYEEAITFIRHNCLHREETTI